MPEGHGQQRLGLQPPVRDRADEVLRGQRVRDLHVERQRVRLLRIARLEEELLRVEHVLAVRVLNDDPEGLRRAVDLQ